MSLKPDPIGSIPEETARIAKAVFRKGNTYLKLRDELGVLYADEDFAALFPKRGQPALAPWRLALVTVMQFMENLTDRQAADAVRAGIDWKYVLGLELDNAGFDFSVLSEFRARLVEGGGESLILDRMLEHFRCKGLLKARGQQRTDSTHVVAAIRTMNRLELVGETLRAALNELAALAPEWLRGIAPDEGYKRYGARVDDYRLPKADAARTALAETVGQDGFYLLDALDKALLPREIKTTSKIEILRQQWTRHFERMKGGKARWRAGPELTKSAHSIELPYDPDARHSVRHELSWTGRSARSA